MKRFLLAIITFVTITAALPSCSKCAVCRLAGQESDKVCQQYNRQGYKDSREICETGGGVWVVL